MSRKKKLRYSYRFIVSSLSNQGVNQDCGDCACAYTPCLDAATLMMNGRKYRSTLVTYTFPLLQDWQGIFHTQGKSSFAILDRGTYELWGKFKTPHSLSGFDEESLQVLEEMLAVGLLKPDGVDALPASKSHSTTLAAWLHLTDRCNLRCAYCYLPHKSEDMSLETGKAAIEATVYAARDNGYQQVKFKYAGGEPLLRMKLLRQLHAYARELGRENGLQVDGVVLSNGTLLTSEIIDTLQALDLRLMISLDGIGEWHDAQRPYAGGRGSFADVAESIELALAHDLIPDISVTVSGRNAAGLPETVAWLLERDLPFSLNFYRQNDFSVSHADLKLEEEQIIAGMLAAFKVIEANLPKRSLLASLVDRANLSAPHLRTCSVGDSYLVFNQHGQVSQCQMKMDAPLADIHTENLLQVIRDSTQGIQNLSVEEKEGCRDCEWKYWCAGGCPLETHRATGRFDVKSPNCNIYKAIFPEVLRLEGLRLLKENGVLEGV